MKNVVKNDEKPWKKDGKPLKSHAKPMRRLFGPLWAASTAEAGPLDDERHGHIERTGNGDQVVHESHHLGALSASKGAPRLFKDAHEVGQEGFRGIDHHEEGEADEHHGPR